MSKPKCYIAGKIGKLPPEVYTPKFEYGERVVLALGYEPVSPLTLPHQHGRTWAEYMKEDLSAMLTCDAVYALDNWKDSPGATVEVDIATKCGLKIMYQP
jgi:hypothetical protein